MRAQHLPSTAPFNVCVYKVSDKACLCWSDYENDPTYALYQIQVAHDARPSMLMNIRDSFSDFLKEMSTKDESYPCNLELLRDEGCVKLVVTNKADTENIGFVQSSS
jgi:hypothetical protein